MSDHNFNPFIAQKYNINIAILLNSFVFWTRTNAAKGKNFHEGRYWCYGTPEYFKNYFPYFSCDQIRRAIEKAIENSLLLKSNFNNKGYDRTNWYALTDKALTEYNLDRTCLKPAYHLAELPDESQQGLSDGNAPKTQSGSHLAKLPDAFGKIAEPIPDNKTQLIKTNKDLNPIVDSTESPIEKSSSLKSKDYEKDERFMKFYFIYPKKEKPRDAWKAFKSLKLNDEQLNQILEDVQSRKERHTQWQNKQFIPLPASYLRSGDFEGEIFNQAEEIKKKADIAKLEAMKREQEQERFTQKQEEELRQKTNQYNQDGAAFRSIVAKVTGVTQSTIGIRELSNLKKKLGCRR